MQELVRALYKRPRVVESLREADPARAGPPDLAAFLTWLWPLTAAPERRARANAQWLHRHLATLLLAEPEESTGVMISVFFPLAALAPGRAAAGGAGARRCDGSWFSCPAVGHWWCCRQVGLPVSARSASAMLALRRQGQ